MAEQVGGVAGVAEHAQVGTAVGQADQRTRVLQQLGHAVLVGVQEGNAELHLQVVLDGDVEQRVNPVAAALAGNRRHGHAFVALQRRLACLGDRHQFPVAGELGGPLQFLAELIAECRVAEDGLLFLHRLVECTVPGREAQERMGHAQAHFAGQRARADLRERTARRQGGGHALALVAGAGDVVAVQ